VSARSQPAVFRYLPLDREAQAWGLCVTDYGFAEIPPRVPYPQGPHPEGYLFTWEKGRVLEEYQLVYISGGGGIFESASTGRVPVEAGQVFVLFPSEWHRYRPNPESGWAESWIGFKGDYADRLLANFYSPRDAVLRVGHDETLLYLIRSMADLVRAASPGVHQVMAARTVDVLARVRSLALSGNVDRQARMDRIQQAQMRMLDQMAQPVDIRTIAEEVGMSYSSFRRHFKEQAGLAPHQYLLQMRLNKAKALLAGGGLRVSEVAERTGFSSVYYFSRLFKQRFGQPPTGFQARSREAGAPGRAGERPREPSVQRSNTSSERA